MQDFTIMNPAFLSTNFPVAIPGYSGSDLGNSWKLQKNELKKGGFWVLEWHFKTQNHPSKAIEMPGLTATTIPGYKWDIGHCGERIL